MHLAPGTVLGSYKIITPLGAGGMGEVYRAKDVRLGREVALKIIPASRMRDAEVLERFEREARSAGQLNNPYILAVYDVGAHEGCPYVVSELLQGETLRDKMKAGPLSPRKAVQYALQIAKGLAAAHDQGIIHRDLKPENIFITRDGGAKILDFGLVKLAPSGDGRQTNLSTMSVHTQPGKLMGTVGYMSPEQVRGGDVDYRSDIFSFGIVLYEMLWGARAFRRESDVETLNAILHDTPPGLLEVGGRVPLGLERVVARCLEKEPNERFQSTRDLVFSLEALSEVSGSGSTAIAKPAPRSRKNLYLGVAAAALLFALFGLAAFLLGRSTSRARNPTYRQLTFRRGLIDDARFSPDGKSVYYSAAWDGGPSRLMFTRADSRESSVVQIQKAAKLLSVSSTGRMAVLMSKGGGYNGTLAEVPLAGGEPRELYDNVQWADWSPDGSNLAAVTGEGSRTRLEYPLKTRLFETGGSIICPRVSPKGDAVAFIHQPLHGDNSGSLVVVGRDARVLARTEQWPDIIGLAWSPEGDEVWFTASKRGANRAIYAMNMSGDVRLVESLPSRLTLTDISGDGSVLITRTSYQCGMVCMAPGQERERDLYWLDGSVGTSLSSDGKTLLFVEAREGTDRDYGIYLRKTDGSPAVFIGEGFATDLSPDGKWVISIPVGQPAQIVLLPTGVGERKALTQDSIHHLHDFESYFNLIGPRWFPDGNRILFTGEEPGRDMRCYVQDVAGGAARPISAEGTRCVAVSPDGAFAAGLDRDGKVWLYPTTGGEPRAVEGVAPGEVPIQWSQDGGSLYVQRKGEAPAKVYRVELLTGRRALWKELAPPDADGLLYFDPVLVTPDGKFYAYSYARGQNDLYLIGGLR